MSWIFSFLLLAGCSTLVPVPELAPGQATLSPEEAWRKTLAAHVDDRGQIDFAGLKRDSGLLRQYVAFLAKEGPKTQPARYNSREQKLAFHLNAFNALTLYGILNADVPASLGPAFFRKKFVIEGTEVTLEDYRNRTIRALGDERVHVALNPMTKGAPKMLRYPFFAEWIHEELEKQSATFFNDDRYVQKDPARKTVHVSSLLKTYAEDYLRKASSLVGYVNRYRKDKIPADYKIEFLPFDWTLNSQPRTSSKGFSKAYSTVSEG